MSLSLRGGTTLKQETRDKVAEAAASLGYVPDRAGVRLRTGKTNVIALVLDGAEDSIDFARQMIQGIGHAIKGTRYHLTVIPEFDRHDSVETIRYILDNRTADGVIITHTGPRDRRVQMMIDADFPFVSHGRTEFYTPHAYHDFHSEAFAALAVERLAQQGLQAGDAGDRRRQHHQLPQHRHRLSQARRPGPGSRPRVLEGSQGRTPGRDAQLGLDLAQRAEPAGRHHLRQRNAHHRAGRAACRKAACVLGRDIQLIYKQTSDILPTLFPALDSIHEDVFAAGAELTRLLLQRIDGAPAEQLQTLSEPVPHWRS